MEPPVCTRCGKKIEGEVEQLTRVKDGDGEAHFNCFYPNGIPEFSLELPTCGLLKLGKLDPKRAKYFRPKGQSLEAVLEAQY